MTVPRRWLGIAVATAIGAAGMWAALLFVPAGPAPALFVGGLGAILAAFALAAFSAEPDPMRSVTGAAIAALGGGGLLFVLWSLSGNPGFGLLVPVVLLGVPGLLILPPRGSVDHLAARLVALGAAGAVSILLAVVDPEFWALLAPLLPLPFLGVADGVVERARP